jgi:beta-mannanase
VLLRFAQEMNGNWYPWSTGSGGALKRPALFVAAWRHVHDVFTAAGATNVHWVWSPIAHGDAAASLYPGDRYVDVIGLSGFNGGSTLRWGGWRSFATIFGGTFRAMHRFAPSKPIQVSEVACAEDGGSKARWITAMFATLRNFPYVTSVVWFDVAKQSEWPIESSASAVKAFARGLVALRGR